MRCMTYLSVALPSLALLLSAHGEVLAKQSRVRVSLPRQERRESSSLSLSATRQDVTQSSPRRRSSDVAGFFVFGNR